MSLGPCQRHRLDGVTDRLVGGIVESLREEQVLV